MSGIGCNLRVTGHCSQGGRKYMEDMFSVAYQQTGDLKDLVYAFFGIFDGHGGPQAATYAKEHLLDAIVSQRNFWSENDEDVLKAIREGYIATHYAMWKDLEKWPKTTTGLLSTSGSTATVAFIMRSKIYIGHVGDTGIVLGYQEDGVKEWKAKLLTKDHKPETKEEKERIEQSGGKVVNKSGVPRVVWNRPRLGHIGPVRRSTQIDEIPFLAVARSLGDFWSYNCALDQFVVSPEPDVLVCPVDVNRFRCLILGTDGLWNMMTPERAIGVIQATEMHNEKQVIINSYNRYNKEWLNPSKTLVDKALDRWTMTKLRADNTSVVTLLLDPPGPPRAQVILKQLKSKWKGENTEEDRTLGNVPTSGGLAVFTHFPNNKDHVRTYYNPVSNELTSKPVRDTCYPEDNEDGGIKQADRGRIERDKEISSSSEPEDKTTPVAREALQPAQCQAEQPPPSSAFKRSAAQVIRNRLEEKCGVEETSSDTENERVFPDCEPKKRRLSLDKKSVKPGGRRRPSLPALNGKAGGFCKSRSLEESTRMLRSAIPMKTLRSRNVECTSPAPKRACTPGSVAGKRQRSDDQRSTPSPVLGKRRAIKSAEVEPSDTAFLKLCLESGGSRPCSKEVELGRKLTREKKHKSLPPGVLEKWQDSTVSSSNHETDKSRSASDGEMTPLSSIHPQNRRLRFQDERKSTLSVAKRNSKTPRAKDGLLQGPVMSRNSPKPSHE